MLVIFPIYRQRAETGWPTGGQANSYCLDNVELVTRYGREVNLGESKQENPINQGCLLPLPLCAGWLLWKTLPYAEPTEPSLST